MALVIYLALNPGSTSREELADLLWPTSSQNRAKGNLRVVLSDIRKKIGDHLIVDRQYVSISKGKDMWFDVHELTKAINDKDLDVAITLYKGDFLESFFLIGTNRFENWQVIEREKIRLELIDGLSDKIHVLSKEGKSKASIKYLKHLLHLEPLLESAHRQLMQAYLEEGEPALALRQFEVCRNVLFDELEVTPAEETMILQSRIFESQSAGYSLSKPPHNLPNFTTPFIGQQEKSRELLEIISDPNIRHISLIGPGGYGKTRLSIRLAKRCMDRFHDGIFWVALQSLDSAADIPAAITESIGLNHQSGKDLKEGLLDYLKSKQILLVLDNFEHLIDGAKLVAEILTSASGVKIITTSRQKLHLQGETSYIVQGMDFPRTEENISANTYDAIDLFIKSALRSKPSFKPKREDLQAIARICSLADGMPLAIELAAAWLSVLPILDIETEIRKGFGFLKSQYQDVEERHHSLSVVAEYSWSMLTEGEQAVFKKLAIMKGPFTRKAAKTITGAEISELLSLSNKSFLIKDSEGLLRIHEWLREFGENELKKSQSEYTASFEAVAEYYVSYVASSWWEAWSGEVGKLSQEWVNITDAMLKAAKADKYELLSKALVPFHYASLVAANYADSAIIFGKIANEFEEKILSQSARRTYALCLAFRSYYLDTQFEQRRALEVFRLAQELIAGSEESAEYAWISLYTLFAGISSDDEKMLGISKQSLSIFTDLGDDFAVSFTLNTLANLTLGELSRDYRHKALAIARKHNGTREIAWALIGLTRIEIVNREFDNAHNYLAEAESRFSAIQYTQGLAISASRKGLLAYTQKDYHKAKSSYESAMRINKRTGWVDNTEDKLALGAVVIAMNDYDLGRQLILEAVRSAIASAGDALHVLLTPAEVSKLLHRLGNHELAIIALTVTLDHPFGEVWKPSLLKLLREYKSRFSEEEISEWAKKGQSMRPIDIAKAIGDTLQSQH